MGWICVCHGLEGRGVAHRSTTSCHLPLPVTGSAHWALGPHWQTKLSRANFLARQSSARGGVVKVGVCGDRVQLGGQAVTGEAGDRQFVSNPC